MPKLKNIFAFAICGLILHLSSPSVTAITFPSRKNTQLKATNITSNNSGIPSFPKCPNPGGTVVASYDSGFHWILGEAELKWGSDKVHNIGNNNYVQCFCPLNHDGTLGSSQGIQTNWLKVGSITEAQKNSLLTQGWINVSNGADFGLLPEPYLAKNLGFICDLNCIPKVTIRTSGVHSTIQINSSSSGATFTSQTINISQ